MTSMTLASGMGSVAEGDRTIKLLVVVALVVMADWLFYGRPIGISVALFLACIAAGVVVTHARRLTWRVVPATALLVIVLVPLCAMVSLPAMLVGVLGVTGFAVTVTLPRMDWVAALREGGALWGKGPLQSLLQIGWLFRSILSGEQLSAGKAALVVWIVPLVMGAIFLALFASANPLIENWLGSFDPSNALKLLDAGKLTFWAFFLLLVWPFIFMRERRRALPPGLTPSMPDNAQVGRVLNRASILRSLLVFNALFAVQTILDVAYLWGGATLPAGMSHATYAHRGAYPLVVAALLAAAFVLMAMRRGSDSEQSPLIRKLVYLWTAQTLLLVVSSILRLDLYVAAYSLTYWRVAAFVWMVLVAIGLILIAARIRFQRSNRWLVAGNALALTLAIYICSIVNLPSIIAHYNVAHSREVSGEGPLLDVAYLRDLGPQAIPALDSYLASYPSEAPINPAKAARDGLILRHKYLVWAGWRNWGYWNWRLSRYLQQHP